MKYDNNIQAASILYAMEKAHKWRIGRIVYVIWVTMALAAFVCPGAHFVTFNMGGN